jgi:hypothetical protein
MSKNLLLWGQANPEAMSDNYKGVYLNTEDMQDMVRQIDESRARGEKIPVKIEHTGDGIGHVVSAWIHNKALQCILELDHSTLESSIGQELVRSGLVKELSLGYLLDIQQTKAGFDTKSKFLKEISLVKKGAREKCKILGISNKTIAKK